MLRFLVPIAALLAGAAARAEILEVQPTPITEWKAVYGKVEPRNLVPARARIGGTVTQLEVTEGNTIEAGTRIAVVEDEKLSLIHI